MSEIKAIQFHQDASPVTESLAIGMEADANSNFKSICDQAVNFAESKGGSIFDKGNNFQEYVLEHSSYTSFSSLVVVLGNASYGYWGSNGSQYFNAVNGTIYQGVCFNA